MPEGNLQKQLCIQFLVNGLCELEDAFAKHSTDSAGKTKQDLLSQIYPDSLMLGLELLNKIRIEGDFAPIRTFPELLSLCQDYFYKWQPDLTGVVDLNKKLLRKSDNIVTDFCRESRKRGRNIAADWEEKALFTDIRQEFEALTAPLRFQLYRKVRETLILKPVFQQTELSDFIDEIYALCEKPTAQQLERKFREFYVSIPKTLKHYGIDPDNPRKMGVMTCPYCGYVMRKVHQEFKCFGDACKENISRGAQPRPFVTQDQVWMVRKSIADYITRPGIPELKLRDDLMREFKGQVQIEMWPKLDAFDLLVKVLTTGKRVAVDVKDHASPFFIIKEINEVKYPQNHDCAKFIYVIPDYRLEKSPAMVSDIRSVIHQSKNTLLDAMSVGDFRKLMRREVT